MHRKETWIIEKPELHDIFDLVDDLPAGQRMVIITLLGRSPAFTYKQVARFLGVSTGTVYRHLKRVRDRHPEIYAAAMEVRSVQLAARAERSAARAEAHSREWHRRKANRRYRERFGYWPWERKVWRRG